MDANESFEKAAALFHKATGYLMPGKDVAAAACVSEEAEDDRRRLFKAWCAAIEYMRESWRDHACRECIAGDMVIAGFQCAYHAVKALAADAAPTGSFTVFGLTPQEMSEQLKKLNAAPAPKPEPGT